MAAGDIKLVYSGETTMTVTNLHSLTNSATAGWQSDAIDNSSNLYEDILVQVVIDFANTAPGTDKAVYVLVGGANNTTYTDPFTGSEGTCTYTSYATTAQNAKLLGRIAYETQDAVIESNIFSVASVYGGTLPYKVVLGVINQSGAAFAGSGNTVKYRGVYRNVAQS